MTDFPSCFGESGVQVADSSSTSTAKVAQNLVTCVYQCKLHGRSCLITITWTRNLMGQGLGVAIDDSMTNQCRCKIDIKPWLFSKRKGRRNVEIHSDEIIIYWDFSNAKFGCGPEPLEGFHLGIAFNQETMLLLGDMKDQAYRQIDNAAAQSAHAILIARREHVFGKKSYGAKVQFSNQGAMHDITIECDTKDPSCLVFRIDSKMVMQIERLKWKFRGNCAISMDGVPVEVFWDAHNWLFGNAMGHAVFMFQTCSSPSALAEKLWNPHSILDPSVLTWLYSQKFGDYQLQGLGFSLILNAWKNE